MTVFSPILVIHYYYYIVWCAGSFTWLVNFHPSKSARNSKKGVRAGRRRMRERDGRSKELWVFEAVKERVKGGTEEHKRAMAKWEESSRVWSSSWVEPPAVNQPRFIPLCCQAQEAYWPSQSILHWLWTKIKTSFVFHYIGNEGKNYVRIEELFWHVDG